MTAPDGKRPLKEGTPDYVKHKYENEYKNKYVKAKRVCFGNLLMFGLLSLFAVTIFFTVFIVVLTDPDALTVDMASTIDKEPSYSVLIIWLIALAGPGGVMLLYPKWKSTHLPLSRMTGGRGIIRSVFTPFVCCYRCLLLSFCSAHCIQRLLDDWR